MNSLIKELDSLIKKLASSRVFKSDFDFYLLKRDMVRVARSADERRQGREVGESRDRAAGQARPEAVVVPGNK